MNDIVNLELDGPVLLAEPQDTPPPHTLIPRDNDVALAVAMAAVRIIEKERRWTDAIKYFGGWVVAAVLVPPLIVAINGLSNQHIPEDKIYVATVYSDGSSPNPAKPISDQSPSEREAQVKKFIFDYVNYRVSYDFAHLRYNYDWVRFTTAGDAQAEYIKSIDTAPDRPTVSLGKDGERQVSRQTANRVGFDAFEVTYRQKVKTKQGIWLPDETRRVRITYNVSKDMPGETAARLDPLRLTVTNWDDHPDVYPDPGAAP